MISLIWKRTLFATAYDRCGTLRAFKEAKLKSPLPPRSPKKPQQNFVANTKKRSVKKWYDQKTKSFEKRAKILSENNIRLDEKEYYC